MTLPRIEKLAKLAGVTNTRADQAWDKAKEIAMNRLRVSQADLDNRQNIPPKFWGFVMACAKRELGLTEALKFSEMIIEEEVGLDEYAKL